MPRVADLESPAERLEATLPARRAARFKYAQDRIKKIVDGCPPLSQEQCDQLATLLRGPSSDSAA